MRRAFALVLHIQYIRDKLFDNKLFCKNFAEKYFYKNPTKNNYFRDHLSKYHAIKKKFLIKWCLLLASFAFHGRNIKKLHIW
jgi:hypothetical protein